MFFVRKRSDNNNNGIDVGQSVVATVRDWFLYFGLPSKEVEDFCICRLAFGTKTIAERS